MNLRRHPIRGTWTLTAALVAIALSIAPETDAAYTARVFQVGADVVANGSGTLNLTGLPKGTAGGGSGMYPIGGNFGIGPVGSSIDEDAINASVVGPKSFGTGGFVVPSAGSGDLIELYGTNGYIYVYQGYVSGSPLASTTTWKNATIASLGLTPGTYTWTWGSGANADSFTLIIDDAPAIANYQGLWWAAPASSESGWGINFAHQGDVIFATWFTYGPDGKPLWFAATLNKTAEGVYSGDVFTVAGVPFDSEPWDASKIVETTVGTITVTFADAAHASMSYSVNGTAQTKAIVPQTFAAPVPSCVWGQQATLALATNYQDLWWAAPAASQSGWGANFTQQGDIIFVTWFTYDAQGNPTWFIAVAQKSADKVYAGPISTVVGNPFNAVPWDASKQVETEVGSLTITFTDGNHATFAYTVNGVSQSKPITRQVFAEPGTLCY